jgi:hypothetical protein
MYLCDCLRTGEINWKINTVTYENFFEDSMKAIENSTLVNRTDYLQKIFQDFYDNARRTEYSVNLVILLTILNAYLLIMIQNRF